MAPDDKSIWTFDRFERGQVFGTVELPMDDAKRDDWVRIFGPTGDRLPRGMMVTAMMEAYICAIQPRPDGNVHASQELSFTGVPAWWGDLLYITVSLADKELRKNRFWVRFGIEARVGDDLVMTGTIHSIWAA